MHKRDIISNMTSHIRIDNVEHLHIGPGVDEAALEERLRGANIDGLGYGPVPDEAAVEAAVAEQQEAATEPAQQALADRYDAEHVSARARRNLLRNVVMHVDKARGLEGFMTNHRNRPNRPAAIAAKQNKETLLAHESLIKACGDCALRDNCVLTNNIDKWMDLHPYKSKKQDGARRPGSTLPAHTTESRETFLGKLETDPMAHCDPRVREPNRPNKAK